MDERLHDQLVMRSNSEPFGRLLGLEVVRVESGIAVVRMRVHKDLQNIFGVVHGGALFALIDEAFQLASNSHGVIAVALNVSVTYVAAPSRDAILEARAEEIYMTNRTASYHCHIREVNGAKRIATAQALAYRTGKHVDVT